MSFESQVIALATAIGADVKALATVVAGKVGTARTVTAGTGLTGGGSLAADRTLAADFGTGAGKVTQGNDSRLSDARTPTSHSHVIGDTTGLQTALDGKQPLDSDLTAIAAIAPANDDVIQRKSGAWINRTIAQLKTDLGLTGTNSGDQTVIPKRVTSATTTSTLTPNADTTDVAVLTAQNGALTIAAPTGTPGNEQQLSIRIKAATAAGAITHNAAYIDSGVAVRPTTTILNKTIRMGYIYDSTASKWVLMAVDAVGY